MILQFHKIKMRIDYLKLRERTEKLKKQALNQIIHWY